jgi:hypothetical protein
MRACRLSIINERFAWYIASWTHSAPEIMHTSVAEAVASDWPSSFHAEVREHSMTYTHGV